MVKTVIGSVTREDGSVDIKALDAFIAEIRSARRDLAAKAKESAKATLEADRETLAKVAKEYFDSLADGSTFAYQKADGSVVELVKIKTKSNTGKTASGHLVGDEEAKRYPKFYQVIVPEVEPTEEVAE